LSRALTEAKIEHAVTGAAAADRLAPFITAIPVTDIWVTDRVALEDVAAAASAEAVQEGHNIVLRQAAGDGPLAFRTRADDIWIVDPLRLFYDLRQDPRRGREQADRLRKEVIGF
jgi:hypothetical protein